MPDGDSYTLESMQYKRGDILEAEADFTWLGGRVMWKSGTRAHIKFAYTYQLVVVPAGKKRGFEVPTNHRMKLVERPTE
jgi:hypothetical protein